MTEQEIRQLIQEELAIFIKNDKYLFSKLMQILDGQNIQLGRGTGTKIGTGTDQKLGFYNKTPVVQGGSIADPAGGGTAGVDSPARNAISSILTALRNIGIILT